MLGVTPASARMQLDVALENQLRRIARIDNETTARLQRNEVTQSHAFLCNFAPPFVPAPFHSASPEVRFVWRELIGRKFLEYAQGIGEIRSPQSALASR
jgi:hypothetical protein